MFNDDPSLKLKFYLFIKNNNLNAKKEKYLFNTNLNLIDI